MLSQKFTAINPEDLLKDKPEGTGIYRLFLCEKQVAPISSELVYRLLQARNINIASYDPSIPCYTVTALADLRDTLLDLKWIKSVTKEEIRRSPRR